MTNNIILRWSDDAGNSGVWVPLANEIVAGFRVHGRVENITEKFASRYAVHDLPGADKDLIQKLGTKNRTFTIKGVFLTAEDAFCYNSIYDGSDAGFFRDLMGKTGSITFTNALGNSDILTGGSIFTSISVVYYTSVSFGDAGSRPLERSFTIDAVEIR